ncbi:MAG: hypothetical protein NXI20_23170 [bacterium]|nr:hypothetical protein [bacterium]
MKNFRLIILSLVLIACNQNNSLVTQPKTESESKKITPQRTYLGNSVFEHHKSKNEFEFSSPDAYVFIGNTINDKIKHGLIFQLIDEDTYKWELKLISWHKNQLVEKQIKQFEINSISDFKFVDKNHDGNKDLVISIMYNKLIDYLFLYYASQDSLRYIEDFVKYPASQRIAKTNYWYSYTNQLAVPTITGIRHFSK